LDFYILKGISMINKGTKVGTISEFTCTSSIIFLTHKTFTDNLRGTGIDIKEIFDFDKKSLWSFKTIPKQNITNKPMQTLHVVLQRPIAIQKIEAFIKSRNYLNSLSDIIAVEKQNEISKNDTSVLMKVLEPLGPKSVTGIKYAVPTNYLKFVPDTPGIVKHMNLFGKDVELSINSGQPVAIVAS